ncbi:hypothetical protein L249_4479, partial [Ophiocordyceps polyrhachis-furcata BCC 54312]
MPNTEKITFAKLSGGDNYTHWALRMDSLLIREKLQGALGSETHNKSEEADRRAVPIAVIAPDLDGRTKLQLHHFFNTITSPAFNSSSILTKPPSRSRDVGPAVAGLRPLYVIEARLRPYGPYGPYKGRNV